MDQIQIGIIGGSGLYDMAELTDREEVALTTPFGDPSGPYVLGTLRGQRVAFLARHGAGHRLLPSELNFRANIFGFKTARRRAHPVGERGRQPEGGVPAARHRRPRSVLRSHASGRISTFFGRRPGRARRRSRIRSAAILSGARARVRRGGRRDACTGAAPTSAWKGRSSRRWPSRSSTARGAWTSSA